MEENKMNMNKNNIKAFEDGVIEIKFILTDEAVEYLNNAGYADMLKTYNQALNNDNIISTFIEMKMVFCTDAVYDLYFVLYTYTFFDESDNHDIDIMNITLDRETAEYFKSQALKMLKRNFKDMQKCTHHTF